MSRIDSLPPLSEVIATHGLAARKSLGQNFILDLNLTARIARLAGDLTECDVLEIGPGPGGLTRGLLAEGARPHAEDEALPHNHDRYKRRIVRQSAMGDLTGRADAIAAFLEEFEFSPVWLERLIATLICLRDWQRLETTLAAHAPALGFTNIPKAVAEAESDGVLGEEDRAKLAAALGQWAPASLTPDGAAPAKGEIPV